MKSRFLLFFDVEKGKNKDIIELLSSFESNITDLSYILGCYSMVIYMMSNMYSENPKHIIPKSIEEARFIVKTLNGAKDYNLISNLLGIELLDFPTLKMGIEGGKKNYEKEKSLFIESFNFQREMYLLPTYETLNFKIVERPVTKLVKAAAKTGEIYIVPDNIVLSSIPDF